MAHNGEYSEQQLVRLVGRKDMHAMRELYNRHASYLTAVCSRYVPDSCLRDVLHDSFIKIFSSITSFDYRGDGSLRRWMTRISVNESLRYLQKSRDLNFIQYADELPDISDDNEDNEDISLHDIPTDTIHRMIRDMPTGYRTVFSLYAIEGLGHKEIAETLGISISTSASQYHRAKKMLAQMISEHNLQSKRL